MAKKMYREDLPPSVWEESTVGTVKTTYVGWSDPTGNSETLLKCVIMKVVEDSSDGTGSITFADGNYEFDHSWPDRALLDYIVVNKSRRSLWQL